jgi:integrase
MIDRVKAYLAYRRNLGYALHIEGAELLRFARYADERGHRGAITTDLALRWATLPRQASPLYRARRLEIVRCFAKHQSAIEPATEIPPTGLLGPAHRRTTPHIYSPDEIAALVASAAALPPTTGLRPRTYSTLFGLLACTGLRISEALRMAGVDVDLQRGVLTVRLSKFRKSRLVPLHPSAVEALRRYAGQRDRRFGASATRSFFLSEGGRPLVYFTVRTAFRKLSRRLGWTGRGTAREPRLHDLRHTFACRRLLRWYEEGADVDQRIAALSTYLGHAKVSDTYWYLTATPELMAVAATRFERFAQGGVR